MSATMRRRQYRNQLGTVACEVPAPSDCIFTVRFLTLRSVIPHEPRAGKRHWTLSRRISKSRCAANCPENFENHLHSSVPRSRLEGRELDAMRLYENAIQIRPLNNLSSMRPWPRARRALLCSAWLRSSRARLTCKNARHCYLSWGANGKVRTTRRALSTAAIPEGPAPQRRAALLSSN